MDIDNTIFKYIKDKNVLISVSGGVDSMVLLDILNMNKIKYNYNLEVFHFNHITREGKSDIDEKLVSQKAKQLDLVFHTDSYSMEKFGKDNNISEEEAGRILRKKAIENVLSSKNNRDEWIIALGHNLDDQIETILMRIIRGTGVEGLIGMRSFEKNIIRPLLKTSKNDIISYAKTNNIEYIDDFTNFQNEYTRNSIRNELIPFIKEKYNPNIYLAITNLSKLALSEREFVDKRIDSLIANFVLYKDKNKSVFKKSDLIKFSEFEIKEIIRKEITRIKNSNYNFENVHYEEILRIIFSKKAYSKTFNDLIFYNSSDEFIISKILENELKNSLKINLKDDKKYIFNGYIISSEEDNIGLILPIDKEIIIRTRKNGDRIMIDNKEKKLKDFLIDKKVDRYLRDFLPIIEFNEEIVMVSDIYIRDLGYKDGVRVSIKKEKENYE